MEAPTKTLPQAMLMAAGLGTRLLPFTGVVAKPLLPLMGVPMAQYAVDLLLAAGVRKIVANVHHLPEATALGLRGLELGEASLEVSDESQLLLGSAGGIKKAAAHFGGKPFFLLNSDVVCDVDLAALYERHQFMRSYFGVRMTLAVFSEGPAGAKYSEIKLDERRGLIRSLGEKSEKKPFFVGVAVIEPEALANVPESGPAEFVPSILEPAIRAGRAGVFMVDNTGETPDERAWFDVGSPELWHSTHLDLMRKLESGNISELWRSRIEKENLKLAPQLWVSRKSGLVDLPTGWEGPAYWSPEHGAAAPSSFGPNTVLYGAASGSGPGIGFRGIWKDL